MVTQGFNKWIDPVLRRQFEIAVTCFKTLLPGASFVSSNFFLYVSAADIGFGLHSQRHSILSAMPAVSCFPSHTKVIHCSVGTRRRKHKASFQEDKERPVACFWMGVGQRTVAEPHLVSSLTCLCVKGLLTSNGASFVFLKIWMRAKRFTSALRSMFNNDYLS